MEMTYTKEVMPKRDTRGRPAVFNLPALSKGQGYDFPVEANEDIAKLRGSLFASAHYHKIKIKTRYENGVLTVWRR